MSSVSENAGLLQKFFGPHMVKEKEGKKKKTELMIHKHASNGGLKVSLRMQAKENIQKHPHICGPHTYLKAQA